MSAFISIEGIAKRYGATTIFDDLWLGMPRGGFGVRLWRGFSTEFIV